MRRRGRSGSDKANRRLFGDSLEEYSALNYLINMIDSPLVHNVPEELVKYSAAVFGKSRVCAMFKKRGLYAVKERDSDYHPLDEISRLMEAVSSTAIKLFLKENIAPLASKRLDVLCRKKKSSMEERLDHLADLFDLNETEIHLAALCYFMSANSLIDLYLGCSVIDLQSPVNFRNFCHHVLGLQRSDMADAFARGTLFKTGILEKGHGRIEVSDWCSSYISGLDGTDLKHHYFTRDEEEAPALEDFEVPENELNVLQTVLQSPKPQNILLYGEPGTGKTSLARRLAKKFGRELLSVRIPKFDDNEQRLRAIYATLNCADPKRSLVLIDEADDVLNAGDGLFFRSRNDKSWINSMLDTNKKKIIWITNRTDVISASTMRRFSFALHFKPFTEDKRYKVLVHELKQRGFERYFSESDVRSLCADYKVSAGGLINALNVLEADNGGDKEAALQKIRTVLQSHVEAITGKSMQPVKKKDFAQYSIKGLNCSTDICNLPSMLRSYISRLENREVKTDRPMSMLFYGMPGTGKSEFVYYLGHELKKDVLLKRSSDIQSMYVGETEKNIAEAFREAREDNKILFFDEADSFLFPRQSAQRSWEISHTNEVLTQLENHEGIVIFATNDMPGLDHAAMRRFRFKIEFRPLTPHGVMELYNTVLAPLAEEGNTLNQAEQQRLVAMQNLTPGDFAVVKDQFSFTDKSQITHKPMIEALVNEVRYKSTSKSSIGFRQSA